MSPKFKEINGFVFKIYSNEELRMHIHVVKAENEAKYWLEPDIEWQKILALVVKN